jgi:putative transposase
MVSAAHGSFMETFLAPAPVAVEPETVTQPVAKPTPKPTVVRCYPLQHHANDHKVFAVAAVLPLYQDTVHAVQSAQWREWLGGNKFWNRRSMAGIPTELSARFVRSAQNQAVAGLDSWLSLTVEAIKTVITRSSLPEETKADLWWLNACKAHHSVDQLLPVWEYTVDGKRVAGKMRRPAPAETLKLLRNIAKHVRGTQVSVPQLWLSRTMTLDGTVAQVETNTGGGVFPYWVRVSTAVAGKPVRLPLTTNRHFASDAGDVSNFAQITVNIDSTIRVALVKRSHPAPTRTVGKDIALDWGMKAMFATDLGDQLGRSLYPWLARIDVDLTALTRELQRQNIPLSTNTRYQNMQTRIREYTVNEINRVLNQVIAIHDPRSITVEKLDFRGGGLSKRMNRLLTRIGRAAVTKKLVSLTETVGVTIHEVNPAYTSQECSSCGYCDPKNRQALHFVCRFCGNTLNADTNGARNIARRRSAELASIYISRKEILQRLDTNFSTRWGLPTDAATKLRSQPAKRRTITPNNRRANSATPPGDVETTNAVVNKQLRN